VRVINFRIIIIIKDWMIIRMVGGRVFLLVPAHSGSPGQRAVKRLLCCCCLQMWPDNREVDHNDWNTSDVLGGVREAAHHQTVGLGPDGHGMLRLNQPRPFVTTSHIAVSS